MLAGWFVAGVRKRIGSWPNRPITIALWVLYVVTVGPLFITALAYKTLPVPGDLGDLLPLSILASNAIFWVMSLWPWRIPGL